MRKNKYGIDLMDLINTRVTQCSGMQGSHKNEP